MPPFSRGPRLPSGLQLFLFLAAALLFSRAAGQVSSATSSTAGFFTYSAQDFARNFTFYSSTNNNPSVAGFKSDGAKLTAGLSTWETGAMYGKVVLDVQKPFITHAEIAFTALSAPSCAASLNCLWSTFSMVLHRRSGWNPGGTPLTNAGVVDFGMDAGLTPSGLIGFSFGGSSSMDGSRYAVSGYNGTAFGGIVENGIKIDEPTTIFVTVRYAPSTTPGQNGRIYFLVKVGTMIPTQTFSHYVEINGPTLPVALANTRAYFGFIGKSAFASVLHVKRVDIVDLAVSGFEKFAECNPNTAVFIDLTQRYYALCSSAELNYFEAQAAAKRAGGRVAELAGTSASLYVRDLILSWCLGAKGALKGTLKVPELGGARVGPLIGARQFWNDTLQDWEWRWESGALVSGAEWGDGQPDALNQDDAESYPPGEGVGVYVVGTTGVLSSFTGIYNTYARAATSINSRLYYLFESDSASKPDDNLLCAPPAPHGSFSFSGPAINDTLWRYAGLSAVRSFGPSGAALLPLSQLSKGAVYFRPLIDISKPFMLTVEIKVGAIGACTSTKGCGYGGFSIVFAADGNVRRGLSSGGTTADDYGCFNGDPLGQAMSGSFCFGVGLVSETTSPSPSQGFKLGRDGRMEWSVYPSPTLPTVDANAPHMLYLTLQYNPVLKQLAYHFRSGDKDPLYSINVITLPEPLHQIPSFVDFKGRFADTAYVGVAAKSGFPMELTLSRVDYRTWLYPNCPALNTAFEYPARRDDAAGTRKYYALCNKRTYTFDEAEAEAVASGGKVAEFVYLSDWLWAVKNILAPCMLGGSGDGLAGGSGMSKSAGPWLNIGWSASRQKFKWRDSGVDTPLANALADFPFTRPSSVFNTSVDDGGVGFAAIGGLFGTPTGGAADGPIGYGIVPKDGPKSHRFYLAEFDWDENLAPPTNICGASLSELDTPRTKTSFSGIEFSQKEWAYAQASDDAGFTDKGAILAPSGPRYFKNAYNASVYGGVHLQSRFPVDVSGDFRMSWDVVPANSSRPCVEPALGCYYGYSTVFFTNSPALTQYSARLASQGDRSGSFLVNNLTPTTLTRQSFGIMLSLDTNPLGDKLVQTVRVGIDATVVHFRTEPQIINSTATTPLRVNLFYCHGNTSVRFEVRAIDRPSLAISEWFALNRSLATIVGGKNSSYIAASSWTTSLWNPVYLSSLSFARELPASPSPSVSATLSPASTSSPSSSASASSSMERESASLTQTGSASQEASSSASPSGSTGAAPSASSSLPPDAMPSASPSVQGSPSSAVTSSPSPSTSSAVESSPSATSSASNTPKVAPEMVLARKEQAFRALFNVPSNATSSSAAHVAGAFKSPASIAVSPRGDLFVADAADFTVTMISWRKAGAGAATTMKRLMGTPGVRGSGQDAVAAAASGPAASLPALHSLAVPSPKALLFDDAICVLSVLFEGNLLVSLPLDPATTCGFAAASSLPSADALRWNATFLPFPAHGLAARCIPLANATSPLSRVIALADSGHLLLADSGASPWRGTVKADGTYLSMHSLCNGSSVSAMQQPSTFYLLLDDNGSLSAKDADVGHVSFVHLPTALGIQEPTSALLVGGGAAALVADKRTGFIWALLPSYPAAASSSSSGPLDLSKTFAVPVANISTASSSSSAASNGSARRQLQASSAGVSFAFDESSHRLFVADAAAGAVQVVEASSVAPVEEQQPTPPGYSNLTIAAGVIALIILIPLTLLALLFTFFYCRALRRRRAEEERKMLRVSAAQRLLQAEEAGASTAGAAVVDALSLLGHRNASLFASRSGLADPTFAAAEATANALQEQVASAVTEDLLKEALEDPAEAKRGAPSEDGGGSSAVGLDGSAEDEDQDERRKLLRHLSMVLPPDVVRSVIRRSIAIAAATAEDPQALSAATAASAASSDAASRRGSAAAVAAAVVSRDPQASSQLHRAIISRAVEEVLANEPALLSTLAAAAAQATPAAIGDPSEVLDSQYAKCAQKELALPLTATALVPLPVVLAAKKGDSAPESLALAKDRLRDRVSAALDVRQREEQDDEDEDEAEGDDLAAMPLLVEEGETESPEEAKQTPEGSTGTALHALRTRSSKDRADENENLADGGAGTAQISTVRVNMAASRHKGEKKGVVRASTMKLTPEQMAKRSVEALVVLALNGAAKKASALAIGSLNEEEDAELQRQRKQQQPDLLAQAAGKRLSRSAEDRVDFAPAHVRNDEATASPARASVSARNDTELEALVTLLSPQNKRRQSRVAAAASEEEAESPLSQPSPVERGRKSIVPVVAKARPTAGSMNPLHGGPGASRPRSLSSLLDGSGSQATRSVERLLVQQLDLFSKAQEARLQEARQEAWVEAKEKLLYLLSCGGRLLGASQRDSKENGTKAAVGGGKDAIVVNPLRQPSARRGSRKGSILAQMQNQPALTSAEGHIDSSSIRKLRSTSMDLTDGGNGKRRPPRNSWLQTIQEQQKQQQAASSSSSSSSTDPSHKQRIYVTPLPTSLGADGAGGVFVRPPARKSIIAAASPFAANNDGDDEGHADGRQPAVSGRGSLLAMQISPLLGGGGGAGTSNTTATVAASGLWTPSLGGNTALLISTYGHGGGNATSAPLASKLEEGNGSSNSGSAKETPQPESAGAIRVPSRSDRIRKMVTTSSV